MTTLFTLKRRPWLAAGLATVLALLGLLIPVSYERTTGHRVELTLAGPGLAVGQVAPIAKQLQSLLHLGPVQVEATSSDGADRFVLAGTAPASAVAVDAAAKAFAALLEQKGYTASSHVTPIKERVSGNVYAFARDQVIEIHADGKSAEQIEAEIKQRLAEVGVPDAQVQVTTTNDGKEKRIDLRVQTSKTSSTPGASLEMPEIRVTDGNAASTAQQDLSVKVQKAKTESGEVVLSVNVKQNDRTGTAEVRNAGAMSDGAIAEAIRAQLESQGFKVNVSVSGGKLEISNKP